MAELTALARYDCPACGAQAEWEPGRQLLICPYCGTEAPLERDESSGLIREIDLVQTLRELPEELRGWKMEARSVRCQSCRAVMVFQAERVAQRCDFCGSPALVDYRELKPPISPQSVLPFSIDRARARDELRRWLASRWFAPSRLKSSALIDTLHGVYLPYWTFDAQVHCPWRAQAGHYYYTNQSYRDGSGKRRSRQVRHTRWEAASGTVDHFFDDVPVPGTTAIEPALLREVGPFPLDRLEPYDTSYLQGFVVEHYQVVLIEAARTSREAMHRQLQSLCAARIPGDTYRSLQIEPRFSGETFKHILVPLWLVSYDLGPRHFQVLVNGSTGRVAGSYPRSGWKIFLLVIAILLAVLAVIVLLD